MEQVSETSDYYCKHCSALLMQTQPQSAESTNSNADQPTLVEQTKLLDEVEGMLGHYLVSSGISDQSTIYDLTHHVMLLTKSFVANNTEHDLIQYAIQTAQDLVIEHYSELCTNNATPIEQPVSMKVQDLEVCSSHPKHYLPSLNSIFISIRMAISGRR